MHDPMDRMYRGQLSRSGLESLVDQGLRSLRQGIIEQAMETLCRGTQEDVMNTVDLLRDPDASMQAHMVAKAIERYLQIHGNSSWNRELGKRHAFVFQKFDEANAAIEEWLDKNGDDL